MIDDHLATLGGNAGLIEGKYRYNKTFNDIMKDDVFDYDGSDTKDIHFRGTPRLKKGLNQVKFLYRRGYHSGVKRIFRYGFSIIQHESHLQVRHIDQTRFTAGSGQTPEQREEMINMWSNTTRLCPDLSRTVDITITIRSELASAITDSAEIVGISAGDLEIVTLYNALLRCDALDHDVIAEGERFSASFRNAIRNRLLLLENCGVT